MTCKTIPVPCSRLNRGKRCGKLPTIYHPYPDMYYAICSCPAHKKEMYMFLGWTEDKAIQRWNEYHLYGSGTERKIDMIYDLLDYTKEQKDAIKDRELIGRIKDTRKASAELSDATDH